MIKAQELIFYIQYSAKAHTQHAITEKNAYRKWDRKTPYVIHPIWCAMTLLTETNLSEDLRHDGAIALLLHDIFEDTTRPLPKKCPANIQKLIHMMSFKEGLRQERKKIWDLPKEIRLLKLYDKVSNMFDARWMSSDKKTLMKEYIKKLSGEVEKEYGDLNIIHIAKSII